MSQARKLARQALVQALYQWQMTEHNIKTIEMQFREENVNSKMDMDYFVELLHKITAEKSVLDDLINPCVNRSMQEVNPVELAILRMATYELKERMDIPYKVVINEAVDLTKKYGAEQGHKFVNSVLDKLAKQLRSVETAARKNS